MSAVLAGAAPDRAWRHALVALGGVVAAILLLYQATFASMVGIWQRSDTFAHAFLVPPLVLWLVWRQRERLAAHTPAPSAWVLLPLAATALTWLLGDLAGINASTQLCVTALLVLSVPLVLGMKVARQLTFPLAFTFFMVPVGEFLLPVMMDATADFTVAALQFSGIPVYREGLNFIIPSGSWSVIEACSGVRYLIASFMVGSLFAYLNFTSNRRRWLFVGVSILVPIVANWLRAYMIVMLGHLSGNTIAVGVDHLIYGWVFFGVVIALMFFIGARWAQVEAPPEPAGADGRPGAAPKAASPALWPVAALAVAVVAAAPWAARALTPAQAAALALQLPMAGATAEQPLLKPQNPGAVAVAERVYAVPGGSVTLHVAYYRHQSYGRKVSSSDKLLAEVNDKTWVRAGNGAPVVTQVDGTPVQMSTAELVNGPVSMRRRVEVRQFYWVGGRLTASDREAAFWSLWHRLTGQGDEAAFVTLYTEGDAAQTGPRLDAFAAAQLRPLQQALQAAAGR